MRILVLRLDFDGKLLDTVNMYLEMCDFSKVSLN